MHWLSSYVKFGGSEWPYFAHVPTAGMGNAATTNPQPLIGGAARDFHHLGCLVTRGPELSFAGASR